MNNRTLSKQLLSGKADSKYDYIKVKVWLGEHQEHYYILSRFLISRMLTVIQVPQNKAVKISLDVKKYLVDSNNLDITQETLQSVLFSLLEQHGYGLEYSTRFALVTRFFQSKRPLILFICGIPGVGKSVVSQKLAFRLNMANVLQTDVLAELLRLDGYLAPNPLWKRNSDFHTESILVGEYQKECRIVRRAIEGDLSKCLKEGKSLIVEGFHIDPRMYINEFSDATIMNVESGGSRAVTLSRYTTVGPVIIPILLTARKEGVERLEQWPRNAPCNEMKREVAHQQLFVLEKYLRGEPGVPLLDTAAMDVEERLHEYVLQCIDLLSKNE